MGTNCSCIKNFDDNTLSIYLNNENKLESLKSVEQNIKVVSNKIISNNRSSIILVSLIEKFYGIRIFHKKIKPLLFKHAQKILSESIKKCCTETLEKAELKYGEFTHPSIESKTGSFNCIIIVLQEGNHIYSGYIDINKKKNGYGVLLKTDGSKYIGNWKDDKLNGLSRVIDQNGNLYEGLFEDDSLIQGRFESLNGERKYVGQWKDGKMHGIGKEETNETLYEGEFVENKKHGKGKIILKEKEESYSGEFTNDEITGKGTYIWKNGNTYTGDFIETQFHGKGKYSWEDGGEYFGDYVNGVKQGYGSYKMKDGSFYVGPFVNGKPHGLGNVRFKGKLFNEVEFFDGILKKNIKY